MGDSKNSTGLPENQISLSLDAILDLLSHHHRRRILRNLCRDSDHRVSKDEIIGALQDQEVDRTGKKPNRDNLSTVLHHIHEPKLSEADLVFFDESSEEYRYYPDERLEKWIDLIESEHSDEA